MYPRTERDTRPSGQALHVLERSEPHARELHRVDSVPKVELGLELGRRQRVSGSALRLASFVSINGDGAVEARIIARGGPIGERLRLRLRRIGNDFVRKSVSVRLGLAVFLLLFRLAA